MKRQFFTRIISIAATAALSISLFSGCGKNADPAGNDTQDQAQTADQSGDETGADGADGIYIAPIEGISDDFIRGMDISSILSLNPSGIGVFSATKGCILKITQ